MSVVAHTSTLHAQKSKAAGITSSRPDWATWGDTAPKVERRKGKEKRTEEGKDTGTEGQRDTGRQS